MANKICSYDEAYDIYDAEEIGFCAKCKCDKTCPMYKKRHIIKTKKVKRSWYIRTQEEVK